MVLRNIFNFPLTTNVVLITIFNKNKFFTAEAFIIIIPFFLTLYNFFYYNT